MKNSFSIILFALCVLIVLTQCNSDSEKKYSTGLIVYKDFDSTRVFDTTPGSKMSYHPVKIDLFYPSEEQPTEVALSYGDILNMYQQRLDYNAPIDSCKKVSLDIANAIADYLHIDSVSKLLNYKTEIFSNLQLPTKKFPLIVYASSMNGSSWENPFLYDSLTHHGYVVAVVSSVGKFPGYMSGAVDMEEQVDDVLYTINKLKAAAFIDSTKIGLLSWSLGGTAIAKVAMNSKDVKCLLSYDGTEIHYFGFDTSWDTEYKKIMQIPPYAPEKISVPYMYLSSEHPKNVDSIYLFPNFISSKEKYFVKFNNAIHENFSSLPILAKEVKDSLKNIDSGRHAVLTNITITFFDEYLKNSPNASVKNVIDKLMADKKDFISTEYPHK